MLITPNYKGYHYLMKAYELTKEDSELLNCITTRLYPMIAKKFHTSAQAVERGIRTVIMLCYNQGLLSEYKSIPTAAQFIGIIWSVGPSKFLLTEEFVEKNFA